MANGFRVSICGKVLAAFLGVCVFSSCACAASDLEKVILGVAAAQVLFGNKTTAVQRTTNINTFEDLQKAVNYFNYVAEYRTNHSGKYPSQADWDAFEEVAKALNNEIKHAPVSARDIGELLKYPRSQVHKNIPVEDVRYICFAAEEAIHGNIPNLYLDEKNVLRDKNNNDAVVDLNSDAYKKSYINDDIVRRAERLSIIPVTLGAWGHGFADPNSEWKEGFSSREAAKITKCLKKQGMVSSETMQLFEKWYPCYE